MGAFQSSRPLPGDIAVTINDVDKGCFRPGPKDESFTLGRNPTRGTHLYLGPENGSSDTGVSRVHVRVRCHDGRWAVRNESTRRPVAVKNGGRLLELLSPWSTGKCESWWIGDGGVTVELQTKMSLYRIELDPVLVDSDTPPPPPGEDSDPSPLPRPSRVDKLLLSAKFLSRPTAGEAVGDVQAAERVLKEQRWPRRVDPETTEKVAKAVENAAARWRRNLEKHEGVRGISGQVHVNDLGAYLLAFRVITGRDRLSSPLVDDT